MKRILLLGIILAGHELLPQPASVAGTIQADATITATPDGSNFDYTITLTNTSGPGNDGIATLWFSWVPGQDFMPSRPLSVTLPSGWKDVITHGNGNDGFAIQFDVITTADILAPGGSLTFGFTSADSPAALMGNSPSHPDHPVLTSFVYSQGPLRGDGEQFTAAFASVPEPSSLWLGTCAVAGSLAAWRLRGKRGA
jgi:hypothetical protein